MDAIHDARVASRRIRELLALVPVVPGRDRDDETAEQFRKAGRALGRVRDIDVQLALIRDLEEHTPQAAPALVIVRRDYENERTGKARKLIKTLERLEVDRLLHAVSGSYSASLRHRLTSKGWREQLGQLVAERARTAVEAIAHATGVYFPRRTHRARIGIKQLRYAAEIAEATGLVTLPAAIKTLRKGQQVLGDLHDRQTLVNTLDGYARHDDVKRSHVELACEVLERDVRQLHEEYLSKRPALREACAAAEDAVRARRARPAVVAGTALAVSGLLCTRYLLNSRVLGPHAAES